MTISKRFYSYAEDTKAIAYIDLIGFAALTKNFAGDDAPASEVFTYFENCILPYRNSMKQAGPTFKREVSIAGHDAGDKLGFWYNEVPNGAVNFIYMSDSAILYSTSMTHLFRELSAVLGRMDAWAVPFKAVVTIGDLHHSEWIERPGGAICFYGAALTKAVEIEKDPGLKGTAMRVVLDNDVFGLMGADSTLKDLIQSPYDRVTMPQLKWWLGALNAHNGKNESDQMDELFGRWFTERHTKAWFGGPNCDDAKGVVARAVGELRSLGR